MPGKVKTKKGRSVDLVINAPLNETYEKSLDFWQNVTKLKTQVEKAEDKGDGKFLYVTQAPSFTSNGQKYMIDLTPNGSSTNLHAIVTLNFGTGAQWGKPLQELKLLVKHVTGEKAKPKLNKGRVEVVLPE